MTRFDQDDAIRTMIRRATLVETDDSGSQQKMNLRGLRGERFKDVLRIQSFGDSSVPMPGSEAILLAMGGRSDRPVVLGFEHKDHRPTGYQPGDKVIYDGHGNIASMVQAKYRVVHSQMIENICGAAVIRMTADGVVEINP